MWYTPRMFDISFAVDRTKVNSGNDVGVNGALEMMSVN